MKKRIVIICGPTASGKSARALELARARDGLIVNADSMQLYKELRILTARPTPAEEAQAPHALYGVLKGCDPGSAGKWLTLAADAIREAWAQRRQPIVTGGTGLYLKALMEGLSPIPDVPAEIRERIRNGEMGENHSLHAILSARDPAMAARLRPSDTQRILRALEVLEATGKSLSEWQAQPKQPFFPDAEFEIINVNLPREEMYRRCDARFIHMMEHGALEEVKSLLALGYDDSCPILRAVGVPELRAYLRGEMTLNDAVAKAQQATRHYAKRQLTWTRNQMK